MPERFVLTIRSQPAYWLNVAVYDTADEMRRAARRFRPGATDGADDAMAMFQCAGSAHPTYLGIARFAREHITAANVIHESVHAALVRVQKEYDVDRLHLDAWGEGRRTIDNEEGLAYAVHGISEALLKHFGLVTH